MANKLYCSFCGKANDEVFTLIAGPGPMICDECIGLCSEIVFDKLKDSSQVRPTFAHGKPSTLGRVECRTFGGNRPSGAASDELARLAERIKRLEKRVAGAPAGHDEGGQFYLYHAPDGTITLSAQPIVDGRGPFAFVTKAVLVSWNERGLKPGDLDAIVEALNK
jgi:ClpX C4-type zinc finger